MKGIPCKEMQIINDETCNRLISEKASLRSLFYEASQISESTPQREICTLLSKIADYITWCELSTSDAHQLQVKLSNCLTSKFNGVSSGFTELEEFLANFFQDIDITD